MKFPAFVLLISIAISSCNDIRIEDHKEWGSYFDEYNVEGCFEIYDNNRERALYYNKDKCSERILPASTFKVFSTLVALETSIAKDEELILNSDQADSGRDNGLQNDYKGQTLKEAFCASSVPYFQELVRRIGKETMQEYLDKVQYGNKEIGAEVDQFWLNNTLQITPDEQVGFMKRLYHGTLPFTERTQRITRSLMLQKDTDLYKLYYKTGWGKIEDKNILWVVGFIEDINVLKNVETKKDDHIPHPYFFALNFQTDDNEKDLRAIRDDLLKKLLSANNLWK